MKKGQKLYFTLLALILALAVTPLRAFAAFSLVMETGEITVNGLTATGSVSTSSVDSMDENFDVIIYVSGTVEASGTFYAEITQYTEHDGVEAEPITIPGNFEMSQGEQYENENVFSLNTFADGNARFTYSLEFVPEGNEPLAAPGDTVTDDGGGGNGGSGYPGFYTVTIADPGTDMYGEGEYSEGEEVYIFAGFKDGYDFGGWTSSDAEPSDASNFETSFVMPEHNVTLTANWTESGTAIYETVDVNTNDGWTATHTLIIACVGMVVIAGAISVVLLRL